MKKLLLITGDLATGKSTFAELLSHRYDVPFFTKDTIKEVLADNIGYADRAENRKLSIAAVETMILIFSRFAKRDKSLILEANFRSGELAKIHDIAREYGYELLTLVIRAEVGTLYKRFLHRKEKENRHPAHLIGSFDTFEDFGAYIEEARGEIIPGNKIFIGADNFDYQTDPELLGKIDEFMEA